MEFDWTGGGSRGVGPGGCRCGESGVVFWGGSRGWGGPGMVGFLGAIQRTCCQNNFCPNPVRILKIPE